MLSKQIDEVRQQYTDGLISEEEANTKLNTLLEEAPVDKVLELIDHSLMQLMSLN